MKNATKTHEEETTVDMCQVLHQGELARNGHLNIHTSMAKHLQNILEQD